MNMTIYKTPKGTNIYVGVEPPTTTLFYSTLKKTLIELNFNETKTDTFAKSDIQVSFVSNNIIVSICENLIKTTFYMEYINDNSSIFTLRLNTSIDNPDCIIQLNIPIRIGMMNFFLSFVRMLWDNKNDITALKENFKDLQIKFPYQFSGV
jgi:hypothetical protein